MVHGLIYLPLSYSSLVVHGLIYLPLSYNRYWLSRADEGRQMCSVPIQGQG